MLCNNELNRKFLVRISEGTHLRWTNFRIEQAKFYKDQTIGLAYAVNDQLSISYNQIESYRHHHSSVNPIQETDAINIGYTVGGMTIGSKMRQLIMQTTY